MRGQSLQLILQCFYDQVMKTTELFRYFYCSGRIWKLAVFPIF